MSQVRIQHSQKLVMRATQEIGRGNNLLAWKLLEDAHIFAQPYSLLHAYVHWEMLSLAVREKAFPEICGQVIRFLLAIPASLTGKFPLGNSGRSNVSMLAPMPLSQGLKKKFRDLEDLEQRRIKAGGVLEKYQRQYPLMRERRR